MSCRRTSQEEPLRQFCSSAEAEARQSSSSMRRKGGQSAHHQRSAETTLFTRFMRRELTTTVHHLLTSRVRGGTYYADQQRPKKNSALGSAPPPRAERAPSASEDARRSVLKNKKGLPTICRRQHLIFFLRQGRSYNAHAPSIPSGRVPVSRGGDNFLSLPHHPPRFAIRNRSKQVC